MISRDAIYDYLEPIIDNAVDGDALYGAEIYPNVHTSVDKATKIIRVQCFAGQFVMSEEECRQEANVQTTIQCWVMPASTDDTALDDAMDTSLDMAKDVFTALAGDNTGLGGKVADSYFDEFETGFANLGSTRRGVTYLDGIINREN